MISRITGELADVQGGRAYLDCDHLGYEVLLPACDVPRLATLVGTQVSFHTLHYMEGQGQGTAFTPRLIGFESREALDFFELFTTVKGMGNRKALRALELPFGRVAQAIAERDIDLLKSLPEIGKRTAETIVAELNGKVDRFIEIKPAGVRGDGETPEPTVSESQRDAIAMLVQLGETKLDATRLVERVRVADPELESPEDILAAAYRLKATPV